MSKRKWVAAKLFAVLGGVGLAFGICVPRASAQVVPGGFSNANYLNYYTCNETSDEFYTGQMVLEVNGSGTFVSGALQASANAFTGGTFNSSSPPPANFCAYSLVVAGSSYLVSSDGVGVEVLSWAPPSPNTNQGACPGAFVMSDTFAMRTNGSRPSGAVVRTEITSDNFMNISASGVAADPGYGHCLK
jgi:hypothetical protein